MSRQKDDEFKGGDVPAESRQNAELPSATKKSPGTHVAPANASPNAVPDPGSVVALGVVGTADEVLLPAAGKFTIGRAPAADNHAHLAPRDVSWVHVLVERKGPHLEIADSSTNGCLHKNVERKEFTLVVGDRLQLGRTALIALNEDAARLRRDFTRFIGLNPTGVSDSTLDALSATRPIALVSDEMDCGQPQIAQAIYRRQWRSAHPLLHIVDDEVGAPFREMPIFLEGSRRFGIPHNEADAAALVSRASRGVIVLDLARSKKQLRTRVRENLIGTLLDSSHNVQVVVLVDTKAHLARVLGDRSVDLHLIELRPLRQRRAEIEYLVNAELRDLKSSLTFKDLLEEEKAFFCRASYGSAQGFSWLASDVRNLLGYRGGGTFQEMADSVGIGKTTIWDWARKRYKRFSKAK